MRKIIFCGFFFLFTGSFVFSQTGKPSAVETEKNVKVLQSIFSNDSKPTDAQLYEASQAIFRLTQTGTDAATPELKRLLSREELNTVIRTALVNIGDAGIVALRESLDLLDGKNLAGVIESLGSVRDEKSVGRLIKLTGDKDAVVVKSAILSLGKIASAESVRELRSILSRRDSKFRAEAADALLFSADQLFVSNNRGSAFEIYRNLRQYKEFPAVWVAAVRSYVLLNSAGSSDAADIFRELLVSKDDLEFQAAREIAVRVEFTQAGELIRESLLKSSGVRKISLIEILGIRKDRGSAGVLIELAADNNDVVVRTSAIRALGRIGDMRGISVILSAISSADVDLSAAGKESLSKLEGKEFNATIISNLDSKNKVYRLTALRVIEERRIVEAVDKVKVLFNDLDILVRVAAYRAFSQIIVATPADLELLLGLYQRSAAVSDEEKSGLREALLTICRKVPARDESVVVIEKFKEVGDLSSKKLLMDLLYFVGNGKACKVVAEFARSEEDEIVDHATMLLGRWSSSEVAPYLIELAEKHPLERYRVRTLSGYLRVIRQFGLPLEQKIEMIKKAELVAKREVDKQRIVELRERFQTQLRAKPIFDGKTFEGWEGNFSHFRISDGAIVGGTLRERIPRNEFLCTKREYGDFTLYLEIKVLGKGANAGIQFRSKRLTEDKRRPNEVSGYQADMTETEKFWGSLYDEARRGRFLAEAKLEEVKRVFRPNDWNELKIVCRGDNIKIYINGKMTIDYTETETKEKIPRTGIIGLQIHGGDPSEAWYRNIRIEEF
ncbi:MAG: DUF1080 domain-containing protein [Planctomycetaceae bacterium]|jgi:HEAT repeat protein|nr:DUF1080 domain-containing protein [Planctomycetaceae bacterium]